MEKLAHFNPQDTSPTQAQRLAVLLNESTNGEQIVLSAGNDTSRYLTMSGQIILDSLAVANDPKVSPTVRSEIDSLLHTTLSAQSPKKLKGELKEIANNKELNMGDRDTIIDGYNLLCGFFDKMNASGPIELVGDITQDKKNNNKTAHKHSILPDHTPRAIERARAHISELEFTFDKNGRLVSDENNPIISKDFLGAIPYVITDILFSIKRSKPNIKEREIPIAIANTYLDTLNSYLLSLDQSTPNQEVYTLLDSQIDSWASLTLPEGVESDRIITGITQGEIIANFMLQYNNPSMKILDILVKKFTHDTLHLTPYVARGLYNKEDPACGLAHKVRLGSDKSKLHTILQTVISNRDRLSPAYKKATQEQLVAGARHQNQREVA